MFEVPLKYDLRTCFADLKEAMQVQPEGWVVPIVAEPEVGMYFGSLVDIKDFDFDHPEKYLDKDKGEEKEDVKEEIKTLTFILPEKMPEISFKRFMKIIKENPGDTEFAFAVGSKPAKIAKTKISLSQDVIQSMEDLYVDVKIPEALLVTLM